MASLLEYLEVHLFDFTLDINKWLSACGCSRNGRDRFVAKLGPLKVYLDERRIAVAAEILRKTAVPVEKIGRRVGFKVPRTFQRTFERVTGEPPNAFRWSAAKVKAAGSTATRNAFDPEHRKRLLAIYWRRQAMLGLLDSHRTVELRGLLRQHYTFLRQSPSCKDSSSEETWPDEDYFNAALLTGTDSELRWRAYRITDSAIEHDAQSAPGELPKLFYAIHKHIFEPRLKLDTIRQSAGFHQSSVWRQFTEFTGQTPWNYVRDARLETTALLLLWTSLTLTKICQLVGYSSRATFHRLFRDFAGLDANEYRRRARWALRRSGPPPCGDYEAADYWERAVSGQLTVGEALDLDGYLKALV